MKRFIWTWLDHKFILEGEKRLSPDKFGLYIYRELQRCKLMRMTFKEFLDLSYLYYQTYE